MRFESGGRNWAIPLKIKTEEDGLRTLFRTLLWDIRFFILPLEIPVKKLHP